MQKILLIKFIIKIFRKLEMEGKFLKWTEDICQKLSVNIKLYDGLIAAAAAALLQSCPTLCDPINGSPTGSPILGILQARTLEWVPISFSSAWKWKVKVKSLSRVRLLSTPWTAAYQAPPSMGFSRQEYWSGVPLPSPSLELPIKRTMCHGTASWS